MNYHNEKETKFHPTVEGYQTVINKMAGKIGDVITIDSAVDEPTAKLTNMLLEALLREKKLRGIVEFISLGAKAKYNNEAKKEWVDRYAKVYGDGTCLRQVDVYHACDQALADTANLSPLADEFIQMAKDMEWHPIGNYDAVPDMTFVLFKLDTLPSGRVVISHTDRENKTLGPAFATHWRPIKSLDDYPLVKAFLEGV